MKKTIGKTAFDFWDLVIWIFPITALPMFADYIGGKTPEIAMRMILGFLGAIVGSLLFWLFKEKAKSIKIGVVGIMTISLIGFTYFFVNRTESEKMNLLTCQICGYKALKKEGAECEICFVEINETYRKSEGYNSLDELIKEEQILFFTTEDDVTFENPKIYTYEDENIRFLKDENWKPLISIQDLE